MLESGYHIPVMVKEVISHLITNPAGVYVDLTFGGGGHSKAILENIDGQGKLFSFDQDEDSERESYKLAEYKNFHFSRCNAIFFHKYLEYYNIDHVDGVFADLGVSSYQIDEPSRGFSTRFSGPLDMRMNKNARMDAATIVNSYPLSELMRVFEEYGELKNSPQIARAIVFIRRRRKIETTQDLKEIVLNNVKYKKREENKMLAQLFQALRIEVNDEINILRVWLENARRVLKPGGRLVVISYHSLEDRIVKRFFKFGDFVDRQETDFFGNYIKVFKVVSKKAIVPSVEEIERNVRGRSARLRVCEKL